MSTSLTDMPLLFSLSLPSSSSRTVHTLAGVRSGPHSAPTLLGYTSEESRAEGLCESRHEVWAAILAWSCLPEPDDRTRATGASMWRGCCNNTATSDLINILQPERRDRSITVRKPARGSYK